MATNFNDSLPVAPAGRTNAAWQTDGSGNVSVNIPTSPIELPNNVDLTAQAANISGTNLLTGGVATAGMYAVYVYIIITQAASSSSTMPSVVLTWTDKDNGQAQTITATATSGGNLLTTYAQTRVTMSIANSTNIQYSTTGYVSSGGTPMQYALHLRLVQL